MLSNRLSGRTIGRSVGRSVERTVGRTNGRADGRLDGRSHGRAGGRANDTVHQINGTTMSIGTQQPFSWLKDVVRQGSLGSAAAAVVTELMSVDKQIRLNLAMWS